MDRWDGGTAYDAFMGRWSRLVAGEFVVGLGMDDGLRWLDVGCGTGALLETVVERSAPSFAAGVDPSQEFVDEAASRLEGKAEVCLGDGERIPYEAESFDVVVSGLVLNFLPSPVDAIVEWTRVVDPRGTVSAYVWDYAEGMAFLRTFWDAAVDLDPAAKDLDEGRRFPICRPENLRDAFVDAGLSGVVTGAIEVRTTFRDFDDYWSPFLLGQGPAPAYVAGLTDGHRRRLAAYIAEMLAPERDGTIVLTARAWTVAGQRLSPPAGR